MYILNVSLTIYPCKCHIDRGRERGREREFGFEKWF